MEPQEMMVPMRDGVRLQTVVHLPEGEGPFPGLMVRCMYGMGGVTGTARRFVEQGYAVVTQNVRGRHKSEGGPTGRGDFPTDGYDTLDWMRIQPWCIGRIGTFGGSAPLAARRWRACRSPPHSWATRRTGRCARRCCPMA